jgi:hypothetical protein
MLAKKLSDLSANPRNPRKISEKQLEMLKKSLDEYGDLSGICYNRKTHHTFGGHQRIKVLPPDSDIIIMQTYDSPTRCGTVAEGHVVISGEKYKYREVDWPEQKELAAMIAANKHGGEWEYQLLNEAILELDHANYDMELVGYDDDDLEKQLTYVSEHTRSLKEPGCDEDEAPEPKPDTKTQRGDIYLLDPYFQCESCEKIYEYDHGKAIGQECPCG